MWELTIVGPARPLVRMGAEVAHGGHQPPKPKKAWSFCPTSAHFLLREAFSLPCHGHQPTPHVAWSSTVAGGAVAGTQALIGLPGDLSVIGGTVSRGRSQGPSVGGPPSAARVNFQGHVLSPCVFQSDVTGGMLMTTVLVQQIKAETVAERPALPA